MKKLVLLLLFVSCGDGMSNLVFMERPQCQTDMMCVAVCVNKYQMLNDCIWHEYALDYCVEQNRLLFKCLTDEMSY